MHIWSMPCLEVLSNKYFSTCQYCIFWLLMNIVILTSHHKTRNMIFYRNNVIRLDKRYMSLTKSYLCRTIYWYFWYSDINDNMFTAVPTVLCTESSRVYLEVLNLSIYYFHISSSRAFLYLHSFVKGAFTSTEGKWK